MRDLQDLIITDLCSSSLVGREEHSVEVAICTGVKELLEARAQGSKGFNSERGNCCTNERGCMLVFMSFLGFLVECKVKRMGHRGVMRVESGGKGWVTVTSAKMLVLKSP